VRYAWGNYGRTVARLFRSPYLRQIYNRYPTCVGSSPFRSPATLLVIPYIEHTFGCWHVEGGLYRMVESLAGLAAARGVELRTGARVVAVEHRGGAANGVRLSGGERIAADAVVMNGDAAALPELLGGSVPPLRERSLSAVVMLLGLGRRLAGLEQHNVFFTADCEREFHELFELRRFPSDPTVYVNVPTRVDGTLAPKAGECLFAMANAPGDSGVHWDGARTRQAYGRIMSRLEAGGIGAVEPLIAVRDVWTPRRLESAYLAPGGAIFGGSSHGWRNAFLRPANRHERYRGLYRVGGSSHPGGRTPMVLLSAAMTASAICTDFPK
jgi:diapolycopene oxygenase